MDPVPENQQPTSPKLSTSPLTLAEVQKGITIDELENDVRLRTFAREFQEGFEFIEKHKMHTNSVTFFGSHVFDEDNLHYRAAYDLAKRISELGYAVTTGGGPGIMEAANRGAYETGGKSYGICVDIPSAHEERNKYLTEFIELHYFFTRKVLLTFAAGAYIYFPGSFGTLDELFEILILVKTRKIEPVPIILFESGYWNGLDKYLKTELQGNYKTMDVADTNIYTITDDVEEVIDIIRAAPTRQ